MKTFIAKRPLAVLVALVILMILAVLLARRASASVITGPCINGEHIGNPHCSPSPTPTHTPSPTPSATPCLLILKTGDAIVKIPCPTASPTATPTTTTAPQTDPNTGSSGGGWQAPTCSDATPLAPSQVTADYDGKTGVLTVKWLPSTNPSFPQANIQYQVPNGPTYSTLHVANTGYHQISVDPKLSDRWYVAVGQSTGCADSAYSAQVLVTTPQVHHDLQQLGSK